MTSSTDSASSSPPSPAHRFTPSAIQRCQAFPDTIHQPSSQQRATSSNLQSQAFLSTMRPFQQRSVSSHQERRALLDVTRQPSSSSRTTLSTMERRELLGITLPPAYNTFHHDDRDFVPRADDPVSELPILDAPTDAEVQQRRKKEIALIIVMLTLVLLNGLVLWAQRRAIHAGKPNPFQEYAFLWPVIPCLWLAMGWCGYLFFA